MIRSKSDLRYYLAEDAKYNAVKKTNVIHKYLVDMVLPGGINPIWAFIVTLRYLEYYTNCPSNFNVLPRLFTRIKFRRLSMRLGFSIPINVFGPGLSIPHYGSIVVNPKAKIGRNCRIHAGTNIGMHKNQAPIIGDNVYIGPGAIIFGGIQIANNVSVGANTTISKTIKDENVVVVGSGFSIIKHNSQPWNHE